MLDKFCISLEQYGKLTDRQIFDLYLHARNKDGSINFSSPLLPTKTEDEEEEATYESELAILESLADNPAIAMPPGKMDELKAQLKAKYGR